MLFIAMFFVAELCFSATSMLIKELRKKDLSSRGALTILGFGFPLWWSLLALYILFGQTPYDSHYFWLLLPWFATTFIINLGLGFLVKYQALTENTVFQMSAVVLLFVGVDAFWFGQAVNPMTLVGVAISILAGLWLNHIRKQSVYASNHLPLWKIALIIVGLAGISVINGTLYKQAATYLNDPLSHWITSIAGVSLLYFCIGIRDWRKANTEKSGHNWLIIYGAVLLVGFGMVLESYAYTLLPLTVIALIIKFAKLLLFSIYDLKTKELSATLPSFAALTLMAVGIGITHFSTQA